MKSATNHPEMGQNPSKMRDSTKKTKKSKKEAKNLIIVFAMDPILRSKNQLKSDKKRCRFSGSFLDAILGPFWCSGPKMMSQIDVLGFKIGHKTDPEAKKVKFGRHAEFTAPAHQKTHGQK